MALVDVLIPTCDRKTALAVTLTSLFGQTFRDYNLIISDQSKGKGCLEDVEIQMLLRAFQLRGVKVQTLHRPQRLGISEQRHFLLSQATAHYVHFLDDDVLLERDVMARMLGVIQRERCGFVGCAVIRLDHFSDVHAHEHQIELWDGPVRPEPFTWETIPWDRWRLHRGANVLHLEWKYVHDAEPVRYKVSYIGTANALYDRQKLLEVGGFSWWAKLPPDQVGEEITPQLLLVQRYGGCGILPSGTYHLQLDTHFPVRKISAGTLFPEVERRLNEGTLNDPQFLAEPAFRRFPFRSAYLALFAFAYKLRPLFHRLVDARWRARIKRLVHAG